MLYEVKNMVIYEFLSVIFPKFYFRNSPISFIINKLWTSRYYAY